MPNADALAMLERARAHAARVRGWTRRGDDARALAALDAALALLAEVERRADPCMRPGVATVRAELDAAIAVAEAA